jgi:hypothetical protein
MLEFFTSRSRACTLEERPLTGFELWDISLTALFSGLGVTKSNKEKQLRGARDCFPQKSMILI